MALTYLHFTFISTSVLLAAYLPPAAVVIRELRVFAVALLVVHLLLAEGSAVGVGWLAGTGHLRACHAPAGQSRVRGGHYLD